MQPASCVDFRQKKDDCHFLILALSAREVRARLVGGDAACQSKRDWPSECDGPSLDSPVTVLAIGPQLRRSHFTDSSGQLAYSLNLDFRSSVSQILYSLRTRPHDVVLPCQASRGSRRRLRPSSIVAFVRHQADASCSEAAPSVARPSRTCSVHRDFLPPKWISHSF